LSGWKSGRGQEVGGVSQELILDESNGKAVEWIVTVFHMVLNNTMFICYFKGGESPSHTLLQYVAKPEKDLKNFHFTPEQSEAQGHCTETGTQLPCVYSIFLEGIFILSLSWPLPTAHSQEFHLATLWSPLVVGKTQLGLCGHKEWKGLETVSIKTFSSSSMTHWSFYSRTLSVPGAGQGDPGLHDIVRAFLNSVP
jgi:hypothetical protein